MKLKKILPYLDKMSKVILYDSEHNDEELYSGWVGDVPWSLVNFKLVNSTEGEAISLSYDPDENKIYPHFIIYVKESE